MHEIRSTQWFKKRGYYFGGFEKKLADKYKTNPAVINQIRMYGIHLKWSQEQIIDHIKKKLSSNKYSKEKVSKSGVHYGGNKVVENRTECLILLLKSTPEEFQDITQLTKFDYDFVR